MTVYRKAGVSDSNIAGQVWFAIGVAAAMRECMGLPPATITSLRDGSHMANSLHYVGRAVDLRTHDLPAEVAGEWARRCEKLLHPQGFDVLLEKNPEHLHIEYDPKEPGQFMAVEVDGGASAVNPARG